MKQLLTLLTVCSLALVTSVRAEDENPNPNKKKHGEQKEQKAEAKQAVKQQRAVTNENGPKGRGNALKGPQGPQGAEGQGAKVRGGGKHKGEAKVQGDTGVQGNAAGNADVNAATVPNTNKADRKAARAAKTNDAHMANQADKADRKAEKADAHLANQAEKADKLDQKAENKEARQANRLSKKVAKDSPEFKQRQEKFQTLHAQHANFKAQPKSNIQSVTFSKSYQIQGSQNWHGPQYQVFKSYHPEWHDQGWWHSHHNNVVLVGGGWYYWNAGYWYPAWGYSQTEAYYPYDGPIYVGHNPAPPDQIIASVQASLQEQGYYKGEVDGLLGPLTRAALAEYQQDQGLEATAAMDEPTLESLGMS